MHHSIQQPVDGLDALRARSLLATDEFYTHWRLSPRSPYE